MNWIITNNERIPFQTSLKEILKPIWNDLKNYKWVLTDIDFITNDEIPLDVDHDYFELSSNEFEKIVNSRTQVIWGVIAALHNNYHLNQKEITKISAEDARVWEENVFLIPNCYLEIVAFDSGYTILKFRDEDLSRKFKAYFGKDAKALEKLNKNNSY